MQELLRASWQGYAGCPHRLHKGMLKPHGMQDLHALFLSSTIPLLMNATLMRKVICCILRISHLLMRSCLYHWFHAIMRCCLQEGGQCSFRLAVDAMKQSRTAAGVGPGNPAAAAPYDYAPVGGPSGDHGSYNQQQQQLAGPTAQQYGQLGQGQYNDTAAPGGQYSNSNSSNNQQQQGQYGEFNQQQQGSGEAGPPPPNCDCGGAASMRTSNSARNPGRQFFSCNKPMGDDSRCNFFKWVDALAPGGGGGASQAVGSWASGDAGEIEQAAHGCVVTACMSMLAAGGGGGGSVMLAPVLVAVQVRALAVV
jgi:hypothetical protein